MSELEIVTVFDLLKIMRTTNNIINIITFSLAFYLYEDQYARKKIRNVQQFTVQFDNVHFLITLRVKYYMKTVCLA